MGFGAQVGDSVHVGVYNFLAEHFYFLDFERDRRLGELFPGEGDGGVGGNSSRPLPLFIWGPMHKGWPNGRVPEASCELRSENFQINDDKRKQAAGEVPDFVSCSRRILEKEPSLSIE